LLLHRNTPKRTQWEIPGGKIDEGESEVDAVTREIEEELRVRVRIVRKLGERDFHEDGFVMSYNWFLGVIEGGEPAIGEPDKFDDLRYFKRVGLVLRRDELSANTVNFLGSWDNGEFSLET